MKPERGGVVRRRRPP